MVEHVSRLPFVLDPLIAEAKRRRRRRRVHIGVALLVAGCVALGLTVARRPRGPVVPHGAAPAFYRVGWSSPINVDGRPAVGASVYWIRVSRSHWAVKASVVNLTRHTLRPVRRTFDNGWGMSAVTAGPCSGSTCFTARAASFRPALPRTLAPGARWTGVFRGAAGEWGQVSRHIGAGFGLGYYLGGSRGGFGVGTPIGWAVHIR